MIARSIKELDWDAARRQSSSMPRRARSSPRSRTGKASTRLGWDQAQNLIYIPDGRDGNVTVIHEDSPDKYTVVAMVSTIGRRENDLGRRYASRRLRVHTGVLPAAGWHASA
ncbi:MAG TPA: hypothetical protein VGH98_21405 [Gemmatimonadaceae bacterium]